eukprot:g4353.t1
MANANPKINTYDLKRMKRTHWVTVEGEFNWKIVQDNFNESYHLPYVHPSTKYVMEQHYQHCQMDIFEKEGHARMFMPGNRPSLSLKGGYDETMKQMQAYFDFWEVDAAWALPVSSVYAQIEEIIVIARKTEENLQEIPLSVTAITGDTLEDSGITEFPQVSLVTPNFDVRPDEVRGEFAAVLNIRGQNSTTSDLSIDQAVGININGAPVTRGTNLFGNLFDVEQVEILRGPQGTLFGKNTTGGLVIVTTTAPQLGEFEGYGKLTVGNYGQNDYEGADFNDGLFVPHSDEPTVTAEETNINATVEADLGFAALTSGTFDLTDQLSLTAGARWTEEERAVELVVAGEVGGSVADYVAANGSTVSDAGVTSVILADTSSFNIANDADFDALSWTLALDYQATEDMLYYGSISRGFRSGGIDGDGDLASVVEPEFVLNYELGFKGDFADNTVRWNSSFWFSDYTDIQISSFSLTEQISGAAGVPVVILNNAAEAELYGFESELQWLATDDFSLNATVGYTKGDYSDFSEPRLDGEGEVFQFDRSDEPVGGPEWQYSLTARYGFDVGTDTRGAFQLTYSYIDEQVLASPAIIDLVNARAAESGAVGEDDYGKVNSISLLNASLNFDIGDELDLSLWSKNLMDKEYFSTGFALEVFGGLAQRTVGAPRQFGATVTYDF